MSVLPHINAYKAEVETAIADAHKSLGELETKLRELISRLENPATPGVTVTPVVVPEVPVVPVETPSPTSTK